MAVAHIHATVQSPGQRKEDRLIVVLRPDQKSRMYFETVGGPSTEAMSEARE